MLFAAVFAFAFHRPTGFGAGPAAVSVALLAPLGISQTSALAYAAGFWLLGSLPTVIMGLPALWLQRR